MIKLYTDAGLNTNQNLAAIAFVYQTEETRDSDVKQVIGSDNHELEFEAVQLGLLVLIEKNLNHDIIQLLSDSQIVIDSIEKKYSKHYQNKVDEIMPLLEEFPAFFVKHISDKDNKAAHSLIHQELIHLRKL